ncbi:MAG TPA: glycoside hydrolase family 38 C-terminal domain-containing protein [Pedobacter sp.]|nr:glycoside hydrolase family 38 C-terminal domain-containing protein [Pedobacter sp.]
MKKHFIMFITLCLCLQAFNAKSQNNYFIDGYHGGIWGHYPSGYTTFISDMLDKNPFWKLNLEIEPITWDYAKDNDAAGYERLKQYARDQSTGGRIEFVNPGYGQSYLFNVQGESIIRQLDLGIKKIHEHFPEATFVTYSSEEPCFTSALPQILKSFGYKYASLKNPNTCWGGYTSAYGGEVINWTGPDGSKLLTVPRYETESLLKGSTWQTIAWNNSKDYLQGARSQGIQNPVGMCIQDAGWKNGPWLGQPKNFEYQTWKNYMANIANKQQVPDWKFTQENVQVSLVWGAQILQKLAQRTRAAENRLIMAEKLIAIQSEFSDKNIGTDQFIPAWQNLMLAQHHDSWIVPYNIVNREQKLNWADQVRIWTDNTLRLADSILVINGLLAGAAQSSRFKIYNTLATPRTETVSVKISPQFSSPVICDASGKELLCQQATDPAGNNVLLFSANVVPLGYTTYQIRERTKAAPTSSKTLAINIQGKYRIENDKYIILINPAKGGTIESLIFKGSGKKEFTSKSNGYFNEMKGYFYTDSAWHSSADHAADVTIEENGPLRARLKIMGQIAGSPFTQHLTVTQGEERIDITNTIGWEGSPGIGQDYNQKGKWKAEELKKAFYNDRYKLSARFPLNLKQQKLYKNAAFDVLESKLNNTYYNTWDSIKNNIIVNWVDVTQGDDELGMALFTDHTTSYSHAEDGVLGLTLQYAGMGLWGRNYSTTGPSSFKYALLPHSKKWDKADLWTQSLKWNEPLQVIIDKGSNASESLFSLSKPGYEVSSVQKEGDTLIVRIFNASGKSEPVQLIPGIAGINAVKITELDGREAETIIAKKDTAGRNVTSLNIPAFGIRTIKMKLNPQ